MWGFVWFCIFDLFYFLLKYCAKKKSFWWIYKKRFNGLFLNELICQRSLNVFFINWKYNLLCERKDLVNLLFHCLYVRIKNTKLNLQTKMYQNNEYNLYLWNYKSWKYRTSECLNWKCLKIQMNLYFILSNKIHWSVQKFYFLWWNFYFNCFIEIWIVNLNCYNKYLPLWNVKKCCLDFYLFDAMALSSKNVTF